VVHARTALELRLELRGARLQVAVHDQDPDLRRVLAAKDGTGGGLGLQIVDQLASAWGVRQEGAGGKTIWCTLELPAQPRGRNRRRPPAAGEHPHRHPGRRHRRAGPRLCSGAEHAGSEPDGAKLAPPALRAELIPRARLQALLQTGVQTRLCVLAAPAGFGKTTLLGQWRAASGGRVAWVSLEVGDNDPTRVLDRCGRGPAGRRAEPRRGRAGGPA
jgi:hypothetical protein